MLEETDKSGFGGDCYDRNDGCCNWNKCICTLGCLMWKKEKITLLHSYHYDKVSPSDKKVFCKISGWGVISIGIGLLVTAIIIGITGSALSFIAFALGFVVGLVLLIYVGAKYNR